MYLLSHFVATPGMSPHETPIAVSESPSKLKKFLQKKYKEELSEMTEVTNDSSVANEEYLIDGVIYETFDNEGWLRGFLITQIDYI